jgi:8-oxo-dGTP pyrophosphatase MutT (NUDIX family)
MNKSRTPISEIVARIEPADELERVVVADVLEWIESGAELFRRMKPDVPDKHLVSYFVLVDRSRRSILLMEHRGAGLWLPTGGHVEPDEDPHAAVLRELEEELGRQAAVAVTVAMLPLLVTAAQTRGSGRHTDVSLWYVVWADEMIAMDPDPHEFTGHRWMTFETILTTPIAEFDPAMHRFVRKLEARL